MDTFEIGKKCVRIRHPFRFLAGFHCDGERKESKYKILAEDIRTGYVLLESIKQNCTYQSIPSRGAQ